MAEVIIDDGLFWLPFHSLDDEIPHLTTEEATLADKNGVRAGLIFPTEFPYDFSSFGSSASDLSSPVESIFGSTETESDDDEVFSSLTRDVTYKSVPGCSKFDLAENNECMGWVSHSHSPNSILRGIVTNTDRSAESSNRSSKGTSRATSPKSPPFVGTEDGWNMIYAAAGQVARLKMSTEEPPSPPPHHFHDGRGLLGTPQGQPNNSRTLCHPNDSVFANLSQRNQLLQLKLESLMEQQMKLSSAKEQLVSRQINLQRRQQQQQLFQNRGRSCVGYGNGRCDVRPLGLPQSAWPSLHQNSGSAMRAVFLGEPRRESTGTGVFLPRQYNTPAESRKKTGCSTASLPARVVQPLNLNREDANAYSQPRFHESFMSARKPLLTQQQRSTFLQEAPINHELLLPQEWTY